MRDLADNVNVTITILPNGGKGNMGDDEPVIGPACQVAYPYGGSYGNRVVYPLWGHADEQYTIKLVPLTGFPEPGGILISVEPDKTTNLAAYVYDQNGQSVSGVEVKLEVDVVPNSGGHQHDDEKRHTEHMGKLTSRTGAVAQNGALTGSTDADGFAFTFTAPTIAGDHKIKATCTDRDCGTATGMVWVGIKGLQVIGNGSWALVGQDDVHPNSHYLAPAALQKVARLAELYHQQFPTDPTLRFNDASLERGGLFDIKHSGRSAWWVSPHETHRRGTEIDVRANEFVHTDAIPHRNYFDFEDLAVRAGCITDMHSGFTRNQHYHVTCK